MFRNLKKKTKKITIKRDETWSLYELENSENDSSNYKLHLAVSLTAYKIKLPILLDILCQSLNKQIIPAFKFVSETDAKTNLASIQRTERRIKLLNAIINDFTEGNISNTTLEENLELMGTTLVIPEDEEEKLKQINYFKAALLQNEQTLFSKLRIYHYPITIYLSKDYNLDQLLNLCRKIEDALQDLPILDKYLSEADLSISAHIAFRVEKIGGDYIAIQEATSTELAILRAAGLNSEIYNTLHNSLNSTEKKDKLIPRKG